MKKLYLLIFFASVAFLLGCGPDPKQKHTTTKQDDTLCVGDDCPCEGMECDEEEEEEKEKEQVKDVVDKKEEEPEKPKDPKRDPDPKPDPPKPDPPKGDGLAFVERNDAQPVEEEPKQKGDGLAFVKRNKAQAIEQKKEEELIIEEKDADESVQPPKAEEIMILPPEESDAAFSEMGMVYFAYDKSEITADFEEVIQKNYDWIFQNPDVQIQLEGHCDERGTNEYNLALGERRAKAVFDYLVGLGANPSQFTIVSFGEERPAVYGSNETSWRQNRRVEFPRL